MYWFPKYNKTQHRKKSAFWIYPLRTACHNVKWNTTLWSTDYHLSLIFWLSKHHTHPFNRLLPRCVCINDTMEVTPKYLLRGYYPWVILKFVLWQDLHRYLWGREVFKQHCMKTKKSLTGVQRITFVLIGSWNLGRAWTKRGFLTGKMTDLELCRWRASHL